MPVAQLMGGFGKRLQLCRSQVPAGDADPRQRSIGGLVQPQDTGAGIGIRT